MQWISLFPVLFFFILLPIMGMQQKKINKAIEENISKMKNGEDNKMRELALTYISKYCLIYTLSVGTVEGTIKEVKDNGLSIETPTGLEAINLDLVVRIREYPVNKKGKRKTFVFD